MNESNDTIIPFEKYAYIMELTDWEFYANVIVHPNDSTYGEKLP